MTKTTIALVAALIAGTASVASAQEFDPNLGNRYPSYDEPTAATPGLQSSQVRLQNKQGLRSSQVRLRDNTRGEVGQTFTTQTFPSGGRPQVHTFRYDSSPVISSF